MGIQVNFKGDYTIRSLLVAQRDKDIITRKREVVYRYKYGRLEFEEECIGNLQGPLGKM